MDISQNPANLVKYQDNPEIMKVCPHLLLHAELLRCCVAVASCIQASASSGNHTSCIQEGIIDVGGEKARLCGHKPLIHSAQRTGFDPWSGALQVLAKLSSLFPQQAGVMPDFAPPEAPQ